jgi:chromosomal replication initiator protein
MQHTEQVQGVPSGVGEGANKPEVSGKASCNARGDRVRAMLRVRFGEDIYSSWFASMEFENFDGRVVRASVPVKFLKNWIQSHYSDDLLQCCAAEFTGVERVDVACASTVSPMVVRRERHWPCIGAQQVGSGTSL